jgi:hypothetical protein
VTAIREIVVVERRTTELDESTYENLQNLPSVADLIDRGIIALIRSREVPYGVKAGPYVGTAILSADLSLRISEKSVGALKSLLVWSVPSDLRESSVPSPASFSGDILPQIARHFIRNLAYYLAHGRQKAYVRSSELSLVPNGSINVARTASLRARGKFSTLSVERFVMTANILPNRLLAAALTIAEAIFRDTPEDRDSLTEALMLAPMFADVQSSLLETTEWSERNALFETALSDARTTHDLAAALAYARPLLLHLGVPYADTNSTLPRAYFLNLETLFEDAVRNLLATIAEREGRTAYKGDRLRRPLFRDTADRYIADPDVAVTGPGGETVCILDCKYKDYPQNPEHSDVYQILAHSSAFASRVAILVYPGDVAQVREIGTTEENVKVLGASVRPDHLEEDARHLAGVVGIGGIAAVATQRSATSVWSN